MRNPSSLKNRQQRRLLHQQLVTLIERLGVTPEKLANIMFLLGRGIKRHDYLHGTDFWRTIKGTNSSLPHERVIAMAIPRWTDGRHLPNWEHLVLLKLLADALEIPLTIPREAAPNRYLNRKHQIVVMAEGDSETMNPDDARALLNGLWKYAQVKRLDIK